MDPTDSPAGAYPLRRDQPFSNRFRGISLGHLDNFEGGQYGERNLTSALFEGRDDSQEAVQMEVWSAPGLSKPSFREATKQRYTPISKGFRFGPSWSNHWVRITLRIKKEWHSKERVQLEFDPGCEAMIFNLEGLPLQGITGGYGGDRRVEYIIPEKERAYPVRLYIEVSANGMFGISQDGNVDPDRYFSLESADIVVPRMEAWHLLWDFRVIKDLTRNLPTNVPLCLKSQTVAMDITNAFRYDDLSSIAKCRKIAERIFGQGWQAKGAGIYTEDGEWDGVGGHEDVPVWAIGNCHIDTAWLWPFRATQQKIARSWSTQIDLMERYPEYRFTTSTAQQFKWLEQLYPSLFSRLKAKVEEGTFLPIGGSWVESDTNMPSGEALVRQFLFGQRYFKSRFGSYSSVYWLPDSFGYAGNLPQICRLAGMPFFFTQKLSWSQINGFPHSSFNWIGIDGTQLCVHMTPVDTYTAQANVGDVLKAVRNNHNLEWTDNGLLTYGNGDGGGGPLAPMVETLRRIRAAANESRDVPKVTQGRSVPEFFKNLLRKTDHGEKLPTWRGELYLEYHRGTYTSHGSIKRHNRKSEVLMREIEYAATLASISNKKYNYPKSELNNLWEDVLLCQFHDVLPGSAIAMVYEDAERIYARVQDKGAALLQEAMQALMQDSTSLGDNSRGSVDGLVALNTLSFARQEVVRVPVSHYDGVSAFVPCTEDQDSGYMIFQAVPGNGLASPMDILAYEQTVVQARAAILPSAEGGNFYILANRDLTIKISETGRITSIFDNSECRELIPKGKTAGLARFRDEPLNFEAWDIDAFYYDTREEVSACSVQVVEPCGLRASLLMVYRQGPTTFSVTLSLDAVASTPKANALALIRFDAEVDFQEHRVLYKFELPVDINADTATYEIQYGTISRPTHENTTWDKAKFEVCGHRFSDLSEFGYGCALLNDCKYGYSTRGNVMSLTLLKGARAPDPEQDQGRHVMSWAILPHRGSFLESDVPQAAMAFNIPLHLRKVPRRGGSDRTTLAAISHAHPVALNGSRNVFLDCVKRGEDDDFAFSAARSDGTRSVILRLYEAFGGAGRVDVVTSWDVAEAAIVDTLERFQEPVEVVALPSGKPECGNGQSLMSLKLRPFQVLTLRLLFNE